MSITGIRRTLLKFERAANKNQDQRSKYPNDPTKFIDSEADLDAAIKALLPLAQSPILAYPELVKSSTITLLVGLLSHENVDIVIDVVEVIHELTDEEVGEEAEDEDEQSEKDAALKLLIEGLVCCFLPWCFCTRLTYGSSKIQSSNCWFKTCHGLMKTKSLIDRVFSMSSVRFISI